MPPDQPTTAPTALSVQRVMDPVALETPRGLDADDPPGEEPGVVVLFLFMASVFGFATVVTMLGPLLVDLSRELDVSLGQAGLLAAALAVPWALAAPFAGILSDRLGRRPMIVLALTGLGAVTLGAGFAPSYSALVVLRMLAGTFGAFGPAILMAVIGDLYRADRRGMAMGWFNMGFSLAAIVGTPAVGAVGGLFGWRWAFAATGLFLLAMGLVFRLGFPLVKITHPGSSVLATYRAVVDVSGLWNVLGANLLERSLFNVGVLYLPSFLILSYGLDAVSVAPTLVLVAVGSVVGNVLGGWLGDRLPKAGIFVVAQAAAGLLAVAVFLFPVGLAVSAIGGGLFGLTNAVSRPSLLALGTGLSSQHRGAVVGLFSLSNQMGIVLGASVGGLAIGLGGYPALAAVMVGCGGFASLLAAPLIRRP